MPTSSLVIIVVAFIAGILLALAVIALLHCLPVRSNGKEQKLKETLKNLQDAQQQLILQEKMASIGMLTAGIAHEIKNPLNFINNFSDVTKELLDELKSELEKDSSDKAAIKGILEDITTNCKKIQEHGKRAESIVKNMLIQARTSVTHKTPLDINELLEEYLNLAYHGMRAQNNQLNAKLEKKLDKTLPHITVNQQNLGRVFLNIINNGLYAANERVSIAGPAFMPTITISTEQDDQYVIVKITDNGKGIPEALRTKIFEPFFTTKPAGQGTGLGLPMCYDIIVQEHQGKLEVNSKPEEFTEFIIKLPKDSKV